MCWQFSRFSEERISLHNSLRCVVFWTKVWHKIVWDSVSGKLSISWTLFFKYFCYFFIEDFSQRVYFRAFNFLRTDELIGGKFDNLNPWIHPIQKVPSLKKTLIYNKEIAYHRCNFLLWISSGQWVFHKVPSQLEQKNWINEKCFIKSLVCSHFYLWNVQWNFELLSLEDSSCRFHDADFSVRIVFDSITTSTLQSFKFYFIPKLYLLHNLSILKRESVSQYIKTKILVGQHFGFFLSEF